MPGLFLLSERTGIAEIVYFLQNNGGMVDENRKIVQKVHNKIAI